MDRRGAVSATGLALLVTGATIAATWAVARGQPHSRLSATPIYVALGVAVIGALLTLAAFTNVGPFARLRSAAEVLDDCIRRGDDARNTIIYDQLGGFDAANVAAEWELRTIKEVREHHPAVLADFMLATPGDEATPGSQAESVRVLAVKIDTLAKARRELGA
jgi:hypothetical protein